MRRRGSWRGPICLAPLLFAGCVSYEPAPVDPREMLAALRAITLDAARPPDQGAERTPDGEAPARFDPMDGLSVDEAVAVAVTLNPALRARRADAGIAGAQLVEAGLLPDPSIGWDFSDSAFDALLPLLRPGERDARIDEAQARVSEVSWAVLGDEWRLKRDVQLAFLDVQAIAEQRALNDQLQQVASRTHHFFLRAREQGAATALQETTAAIQSGEVALEGESLRVQERRARQALNALLGLPPETMYALQTARDPFTESSDGVESADVLTDQAIGRRPDLMELLAAYTRAEDRLRLAIARQWPSLSIGTAVELTLPFFSDFNEPAIQTARAERERLGREVEAAVHALRAEVHQAVAGLELSRGQVSFFTTVIEPRLAESLRLTADALAARQVTAGEILIAQGQVLDARERLLDARIEHARALALVGWVTGDRTSGGEP